ncbi:hypothetical protein Tco_0558198 [Tanacetum coccineum]
MAITRLRTDETIRATQSIGCQLGKKAHCHLNEEKSQPNPIFKIAVDILKQTNFFRAFAASSTIPAIYIQQFWDTIHFDSKAGSYKCQLDEQCLTIDYAEGCWEKFTPIHPQPSHEDKRKSVNNTLWFSLLAGTHLEDTEDAILQNGSTKTSYAQMLTLLKGASPLRSGTQDEGQAGSDPGTLAEGQAGSDPVQPMKAQGLDQALIMLLNPYRYTPLTPKSSSRRTHLNTRMDVVLLYTSSQDFTLVINSLKDKPSDGGQIMRNKQADTEAEIKVKEVVISSVKHAMRAPLLARFKDLPTPEKLRRNEYQDVSKKPPPGVRHHFTHHPPPPPPSGASGASGTTGASDSAQAPPLPPPSSSTHQGDQSTCTAAPSSLKSAALAEYSAWTTTDTRIKPSITLIPDDLYMDDETTADEQAVSSDDEVGRDHIPTVNLRQSWWKPLTEDRSATPEPAWTIPSSDLSMPTHNWASALKSTYVPPQENSLLAQTGDMATFIDWYCKQQGISELTPKDLEGPAFEIVSVFHR